MSFLRTLSMEFLVKGGSSSSLLYWGLDPRGRLVVECGFVGLWMAVVVVREGLVWKRG